ncbi:MAG: hypothetical protein OK456_01270 [Thaumarchaeota archaeon]|nr:hypothetical protein [Nitrososphaerota archaeon]
MAALGYSDLLSLVQSIALIGALGVTVYFSRLQVQAQRVNLETRVLNDLDDKIHHLLGVFLQDPKLLKIIVDAPDVTSEQPAAYYVLSICAHAYHMRQRKVLGDNDWAGWLKWMKNSFQYGTVGKHWKEERMEEWFDPAFREFANRELMVLHPEASARPPTST